MTMTQAGPIVCDTVYNCGMTDRKLYICVQYSEALCCIMMPASHFLILALSFNIKIIDNIAFKNESSWNHACYADMIIVLI